MSSADLALARRLEAADAAWIVHSTEAMARVDPARGAEAIPFAGGQAAFNGRHSHMTCIRGAGLDGAVSERELRRLEWRFRRRRSWLRIDLCPLADRSLVRLLGRRRYRLIHFHDVVVRSLPPDLMIDHVAPGVDVEVARPEHEAIWTDVLSRGFAGGPTPPEEYRCIAAAHWQTQDCTHFLATVDGEPVAAATLFIHHGVAVLAMAATLDSVRGTGAQSELIGARLRQAIASGCDLACSMTIPDSPSLRNLQRWGFRLAYTRPVLERRWLL